MVKSVVSHFCSMLVQWVKVTFGGLLFRSRTSLAIWRVQAPRDSVCYVKLIIESAAHVVSDLLNWDTSHIDIGYYIFIILLLFMRCIVNQDIAHYLYRPCNKFNLWRNCDYIVLVFMPFFANHYIITQLLTSRGFLDSFQFVFG